MPARTRRHHRSLLSRIRKWLGFSSKSRHRHSKTVWVEEAVTPLKSPNPVPEGGSNTVNHHQDTTSGGSTWHAIHHSHRSRKQRLRNPIARLFSGKSSSRHRNPFSRFISRIRKLIISGGRVNDPKPQLFYKQDKDGSYKVIMVKPGSGKTLLTDELTEHDQTLDEIRTYRSGHSQRKPSLTRLWRHFVRLLAGKQPHTRHHSHRTASANPGTNEVSPGMPSGNDILRSHRHRHHRLSLQELYTSWLSLGFLIKLASSVSLFMAAYIITWLTYSFSVMFTASFSGIYGVLYYYEVMWPEGISSLLWNNSNALEVGLAGPVISFLMSMVYLSVLVLLKNLGAQLKTLLLWLFVLSVVHTLGTFIADTFIWQGFGYGMDWLNVPLVLKFLIILFCVVVMSGIGWYYARYALSIRSIRKHGNNIPLILVNRMVLPALIGTMLLLLLKIPDVVPQHTGIWRHDAIVLSTLLFIIIPPLFNKRHKPSKQFHSAVSSHTLRARALIALVLSLLFVFLFRLGLSGGLYIYMKFVFHAAFYS